MSGFSFSQILRPYTVQPMLTKSAVYARIYSITRPRCVRDFSTKGSTSGSDRKDWPTASESDDDLVEALENDDALAKALQSDDKDSAWDDKFAKTLRTDDEGSGWEYDSVKAPKSRGKGSAWDDNPVWTSSKPFWFESKNRRDYWAEHTEKLKVKSWIPIEESRIAEKLARRDFKAHDRETEKRITKLLEHKALAWPRIRNRKDAGEMNILEFRNKYRGLERGKSGATQVQIRGRIMAIRSHSSKLLFVDIQSEFQTLQVMLDFGHIEAVSGITIAEFRQKRLTFLRGDFISAEGTANVTPQGELTLKANKLPELISPSIAPVPTHVGEGPRMKSRHLTMLVNPKISKALRFRSELIWWLRNYFVERRFMEVQTPILADYAGGATARPFLTTTSTFPDKLLSLRIAPELWLKRMVIGGFDRVFEIGPSFRNEGLDATHNPEFTMCEFYEAYADLPSLIEQTTNLFQNLASWSFERRSQLKPELDGPPGEAYFSRFEQVEFIPALQEALQITVPDLSSPDALDRLRQVLQTGPGIEVEPEISLNKLLDNLAAKHIEPLSEERPLYITHHPACMSPLAKSFTCPKTGQLVSARAELFVKGREIANMYEEENDPFEQKRKFELQLDAHTEQDLEEARAVVDDSYIRALEYGLPPTGGWGCGIDRLVMLFSGASRIGDTLSFGSLRNVLGVSHTPS
jgi:lysyl-tRNA synthetase, class II